VATVTGNQLVARSLREHDVEVLFFLSGGPMNDFTKACIAEGIRLIDVRHEQAAAMAAHAYARVTGKVGVCSACSGPGATNLITGIATAYVDAAPVLALGGAAPVFQFHMRAFQELDQVACFEPVTKWATRIHEPRRVPELLDVAFARCRQGQPGPVYVDLPADTLYGTVEDSEVIRPGGVAQRARAAAEPSAVGAAIRLLAQAQRPLIIAGSGVFWSGAAEELRAFVEATGIPFFTTPLGRGAIPEDHPLAFLNARSTAFREADVILVVGTRFNFIIGFGRPPRFSADAKIIQVDIDPQELGWNRSVEIGLLGDAKAVLAQLTDEARGKFHGELPWVTHLRDIHQRKSQEAEARMSSDSLPMHPLRLCKEVRDFISRETIVVVDGHEILNYARQSIPTYYPGHRLNAGPFGCMGVGVPYGLGAKVARPDRPVIVLHGDGSFGMNCMELDTAVRHNIPFVTVISNNAGWAAGGRGIPGRDLGHTRYEKMAEALGCHAEYCERPEEIQPALERAFASGRPAVVNVITDPLARAETAQFSFREAI
jgi:thiamine pyrophosphate-dependent acetolactate synthase large subunit-like protein